MMKKQRDGLRALIGDPLGRRSFGGFLEDIATGLSWWLNAENLNGFKDDGDKHVGKFSSGGYKNFGGEVKGKAASLMVPLMKKMKDASNIFKSAQDSVVSPHSLLRTSTRRWHFDLVFSSPRERALYLCLTPTIFAWILRSTSCRSISTPSSFAPSASTA